MTVLQKDTSNPVIIANCLPIIYLSASSFLLHCLYCCYSDHSLQRVFILPPFSNNPPPSLKKSLIPPSFPILFFQTLNVVVCKSTYGNSSKFYKFYIYLITFQKFLFCFYFVRLLCTHKKRKLVKP